MDDKDLRTLASMLASGQFVPVDPLATFFARGQQAIQFSVASVVVPPSVASESQQSFTSLLKVNVAQGAPRVWTAKVAVVPHPVTGVRYSGKGTVLRVRWSVGAFSDYADIDLVGGNACFPITADAMEFFAQNAAPDGTIGEQEIALAVCVSPFVSAAEFRKPTRTLYFPEIFDGPRSVRQAIPRHAQQVTVLYRGSPTSFEYFGGDVAGNEVIGPPVALEEGASRSANIPGGATNVGVFMDDERSVVFVFSLGL